MQAVILAAGMGSRLTKVTGGASKALVDIGGRPLILHQLEALADHGVGPVLVVIGHQGDEVQRVVGDRAETLLNERFAETNSLYSLWLAREWIKGPFLLLNCDLFFDPTILDRLLEEDGNCLVYDSTSSRGREQTKLAIKQRRVVDIGKDLPAASARGESLGLLKFDADGARAMLATADQLVRDGNEQAWVIEATRVTCAQVPIYGVNVAGEAWTEIDFPYDLDVARREVWPAIWRGRWRRHVYWRRARWVAAAAAAGVLALSGWVANSEVGPARIDWETVQLPAATTVQLERASGKLQRWWVVEPESVLTTSVVGSVARVETRLLMPAESSSARPHYVVAVSVDGVDYDWQALRAERDTAVAFPGFAVGDKDRLEIELPAGGTHTLAVRLIAAAQGRLLVRVRQEDEDGDE